MLELKSCTTVSCDAVLAYFSRVCSASSTTIERGMSLAVWSSPMQDAAFYELSSILEACFSLFSSLRLETLPSSSSIHSLVGFCIAVQLQFTSTTETDRCPFTRARRRLSRARRRLILRRILGFKPADPNEDTGIRGSSSYGGPFISN